jgi:acetylglutamate kinase
MATRTSNLPITRVTPVTHFLAEAVSAIINIDSDKNGAISLAEALNALQIIGLRAVTTFVGFDMKEFREQLRDIDAQERKQLVEAFASKFTLGNLEAEILVEDWLRWLEHGITNIERTKRLIAAKKAA